MGCFENSKWKKKKVKVNKYLVKGSSERIYVESPVVVMKIQVKYKNVPLDIFLMDRLKGVWIFLSAPTPFTDQHVRRVCQCVRCTYERLLTEPLYYSTRFSIGISINTLPQSFSLHVLQNITHTTLGVQPCFCPLHSLSAVLTTCWDTGQMLLLFLQIISLFLNNHNVCFGSKTLSYVCIP